MALEDFTTYTEVDSAGDITVTANKIAVYEMHRDANSYVHYDKGVSYFGNFIHTLKLAYGYCMATGAQAGFWSVSATEGTHADFLATNNAMGALFWEDAGGDVIYITDYTNDNSDPYQITDGTNYWLTIERDGTTLTCKIYSDATRTTLLDTLTITCTNMAFSHIQGCYSSDIAGINVVTWDTENLDLEAGAAAAVFTYGLQPGSMVKVMGVLCKC